MNIKERLLTEEKQRFDLIKSSSLDINVLKLTKNNLLSRHKAKYPVKLVVLEGLIEYKEQDVSLKMSNLDVNMIEPGIEHEVVAIDDSIFMLIVDKSQ